MLLGECYAGEDAEVLFEAMKDDWSGEDEDVISNLVVYVKQYKETAVQATGATAVWNSDMGMYLLTVPAAYVPASGSFDIVVKGSGDIDDVKIRLGVNTADTQLTSIVSKIDAVDTVADGIASTLSTPANFMADVSGLATPADVTSAISTAAIPAGVWAVAARTLTAVPTGAALTTDITALNDLSAADIGTALTTYTAPTKAELNLAVLPLATASALTTAQGAITAIQAVTDTVGGEFDETNGLIGAISIGASVGAEKVIPAAYYTLDASELTITLATPYDSTTVEQILSIFNLTTGNEIYNCLNPRKRRSFLQEAGIDISVGSGATGGVITYIEDSVMADTDKLMIIVNTP